MNQTKVFERGKNQKQQSPSEATRFMNGERKQKSGHLLARMFGTNGVLFDVRARKSKTKTGREGGNEGAKSSGELTRLEFTIGEIYIRSSMWVRMAYERACVGGGPPSSFDFVSELGFLGVQRTQKWSTAHCIKDIVDIVRALDPGNFMLFCGCKMAACCQDKMEANNAHDPFYTSRTGKNKPEEAEEKITKVNQRGKYSAQQTQPPC